MENVEGLFDKLEKEKGELLSNDEKLKIHELLDLPKSPNGFYLDAFEREVSYNGIAALKRQYVKLPLNEYHINEIKKCSEDLFYFVKNYCKILTKSGIEFPEFREYQIDFLKELKTGDDVIASLPRQSGKSVTTGIYLLWKALFTPNINIGIAANKLSLAMEVLDKVKKVFLELPIWLQQGVQAWNKTFIELENGTRIMTSATNSDAFRGFSVHLLFIDECIEYYSKITIKNKILGITQSLNIGDLYKKITNKDLLIKELLILTENGFKDFDNIKETIRYDNLKIFFENSFIIVTPEHKFFNKGTFIRAKDIKENDIINNKKVIKIEQNVECSNKFYDLINVQDGHHYTANEIEVSNCAFVPTNLWNELTDSLFPAQDALAQKQKVLCSTPNGMNHWYHLVTGARNKTNGYRFFTSDWKQVPRYNKDGSVKNVEDFKAEIIQKNGKQFFAQNYALEFLGSSSTLISGEALKNIIPIDDSLVIYDSLFSGLRIFQEPIKNHSYIIGVDPKKEGIDKLAFQVIDVTNLPFKQVASFNSDISYLSAPSRIFDLGCYYNNAMIIVENNIDNSIVDALFYQYDYDGEIYKEDNKNILGFRTTTKSKKILLSLLKKLIEENKFIIYDKKTIDEFFVFVEQKNGSFSAEDGYHDDLIMALMVSLAPFINIKQFDDFQGFVNYLDKKRIEKENEDEDFARFFSGCSFNTDISDEDISKLNKERLSFDY